MVGVFFINSEEMMEVFLINFAVCLVLSVRLVDRSQRCLRDIKDLRRLSNLSGEV